MIQKPIITTNGPTTYHVLFKVESMRPHSMLTLTVDSYADEATYLANGGLMGRRLLSMPSPTGEGAIVDDAEAWLITDTTSPYQGGQIIADKSDTLESVRARKVIEMSQSCADAILAGFVSSALGEVYTYPAKSNDQANLTGSVVRSMYPNLAGGWTTPFWCADAAGIWEYRPHSATQIQEVGDDAIAARLACMGKNEALAAQIAAAATTEAVAAIVWPA